jgi:hypothetical protein
MDFQDAYGLSILVVDPWCGGGSGTATAGLAGMRSDTAAAAPPTRSGMAAVAPPPMPPYYRHASCERLWIWLLQSGRWLHSDGLASRLIRLNGLDGLASGLFCFLRLFP